MRSLYHRKLAASQPKLSSYSNEALVKLVAQQNLVAYELLYDRHAQVIFNLLVRIVGESTTAEQLLQDAFWQFWTGASDFPEGDDATVWMIRIARKCGLCQLRQQGGRVPANSDQQHSFLELAFFDGMSVREIAEQTNTEVNTISARICNDLENIDAFNAANSSSVLPTSRND